MQLLTLGQGITDFEDAIVGQSHDVACPCLVDGLLALGHKLGRRRETQRLVLTHMEVGLIAYELAGANLTEGDTRAVVGVDVGSNLEDETGKLRLFRIYHSLFRLCRTWRRCYLDEAVEQFLYAEVIQSGTKEDRCQDAFAIAVNIEGVVDALNHFKVVTQMCSIIFSHLRIEVGRTDIHTYLFRYALLIRSEEVELVFINIIDALELHTLVDRPREWAHLYLQLFFQFVEQVERITAFAVHLVDEDDNRSVSHAAHLHQLSRLGFYTLRRIDHDDGRVNCCKGAVGIFGKVLVTRGIEDVYLIHLASLVGRGSIVKFHNRGGHRDTTLFLDIHPVGGGSLTYFIAFYGTCNLYLSTEEQELLGKRCLTGIRVGDNRKSAATFYFWIHIFLLFRYFEISMCRESNQSSNLSPSSLSFL